MRNGTQRTALIVTSQFSSARAIIREDHKPHGRTVDERDLKSTGE